MKITKLGHSCLLVEMPVPINRTVLFDPGTLSDINVATLVYLDDIFITHNHADHMDVEVIKQLITKFPNVRITTTSEAMKLLEEQGITATTEAPDRVEFFTSPHEEVRPVFPLPEEIGIHYLGKLSHPGDSHHISESMPVLALPVTAPWGSNVSAIKLALELKPHYIIPIHDWHWRDEARQNSYEQMEQLFSEHDITFIKAQNGEAFVLDV